ncbi:unnamed protein product [marine sediment metagenome]|uniref:Tetratricopeptide repeat protein n=1 Tax=marine sediment metagenome TaxID=412755 RepID=X1GTR6_9ZZZZ
MELFINQDDIRSLLEYAEKVAPDEAYTYQQRAIFEMNRANGNLTIAAECLSEAQRLEPHNVSILHSQAELSLRRAEKARTILEKEKHFDSAAASASALIRQRPSEPHGYHTLCKVYLQ